MLYVVIINFKALPTFQDMPDLLRNLATIIVLIQAILKPNR